MQHGFSGNIKNIIEENSNNYSKDHNDQIRSHCVEFNVLPITISLENEVTNY